MAAGISTKQRGKPFVKGKSGNPSGRPRVNGVVQELARQHTKAAIKALFEALSDDKLKVSAAQALLDRGWGRPIQSTEISGPQGTPISILIDLSGGR